MDDQPDTPIEMALAGLNPTGLPHALRSGVARHRRDLLALSAALAAGGLAPAEAERGVVRVLRAYRRELVQTVTALEQR